MTHSRSPNTPPHHSPPPSPCTIFAPPITPIVLGSSPLATTGATSESPQTALPFRCPVSKSPVFTKSPNAVGDKISKSQGNEAAKKGRSLAESPEKGNRALSRVARTMADKDSGSASRPILDCFSPIQGPCKGGRNSPIDDEQRTAKAKKKRKGTQDQGKSNAATNRIIKSRVTKSSVGGIGRAAELTDDGIPPSEADKTKNTGDTDITNLQLEEATKRRAVWTPPKDTTLTAIDLTYSPLTSGAATNNFGNLISRYGFGEGYVYEQDIDMLEGPTRKRQLEPVETDRSVRIPPCDQAVGTPAPKPRKDKRAQRKSTKPSNPRPTKHTTITSLTTAPYDISDSPPTAFVSPEQTDGHSAKKTSTRSKSTKVTKGKKGRSKKTEDPQAFQVAAPADSLKSLDDQVLLFGTCSQLARDSSPGFTGPHQSGTTVRCPELSNKSPTKVESKQSLSGLPASKNLWSAASRDTNDKLGSVEVVDLESPGSLKSSRACEIYLHSDRIQDPLIAGDCISHGSAAGRASRKVEEDSVVDSHAKNEEAVGQRSSLTSDQAVKSDAADVESNDRQMPHYRGFSTAELAEQVAAFGFKPIKNREKAVSLLEKCWESQNKYFDGGSAASKAITTSGASTSTTGTCAKVITSDSTLSSTSVHEIEGSERVPMGATSKISKSCKSKAKSAEQRRANQSDASNSQPSEQLRIPSSCEEIADSTDEDCNTASSNGSDLTPTPSLTDTCAYDSFKSIEANQGGAPEIGTQITLAVQMQPRMRAVNGIKQPTWYEKILMYDPICLDDLTVWLNTEGLGRIGENSEVNRLTVREWCESKGICCTWRKPGRGNRQ